MQVDQNRQISSGVEGLLCVGHIAGPSRGRVGRQEACPEAARRRTQGRLQRQESLGPSGRQEARFERQEAHPEPS